MKRADQQRVLAQLASAIEQSHKLQLGLLGLMRSMIEIESPAPMTALSGRREVPVDVELPDKPTFSVNEIATILGVSHDVVYDCANTGQIPALRLGRRLLGE